MADAKKYSVLEGKKVVHAYLSSEGLAKLYELLVSKRYQMPQAERFKNPALGVATTVFNLFAHQVAGVRPEEMRALFEEYGLLPGEAERVSEDLDDMLFEVYWHDYVPRKKKPEWPQSRALLNDQIAVRLKEDATEGRGAA